LSGKETKFVDQDFPPNDKSLGLFENVKTDKWKRPDGVASNHQYNIGYQAAVAAIA